MAATKLPPTMTGKVLQDDSGTVLTPEMIESPPPNYYSIEVEVLDPPEPIDIDRLDAEAARRALADPERIAYEEVMMELGIDGWTFKGE